MAFAEDAASVLEQFIHDAGNLPAEITHLCEEVEAKEVLIRDLINFITQRDNSLQKNVKANGAIIKHPKEETYNKQIIEAYEKAEKLQAEKVALTEKAASLLDRHVKRLDIKIRDLQNDGSIPPDPSLPTLLRESPGNLVPPTSSINTGVNTPLHPISVNALGGQPNIAHAAIARLASATSGGPRGVVNSPSNLSHVRTPSQQPGNMSPQTAMVNMSLNNRARESSVSSDTKRRRLNASLSNLPATSSNLARQSSLGPGTPKASTPGAGGGSRAGSAGPRPQKKSATSKVAPHQRNRKKGTKLSKKSARHLLSRSQKASPSTTGDEDSVLSSGSEAESEAVSAMGHDGTRDSHDADDMVDDDDGDDTKYCFCHSVSFGNMIACDNENCRLQWFHWKCVGITEEPVGEWLCKDCLRLPKSKLKISR